MSLCLAPWRYPQSGTGGGETEKAAGAREPIRGGGVASHIIRCCISRHNESGGPVIDPALTYDQFWLNYLKAHSRWRTRLIHACGITIIIVGLAAAVWLGSFWLGAGAVAVGYVTAWAAHFTVEENIPVMFASPKAALWSLVSGLRMYVLFLTARLGPELRRAGVKRGAKGA